MAWSAEGAKARLPENWTHLRNMVLLRARGRCEHTREDTQQRCGEAATDVDHIVNHAAGGGDELSNLQALCTFHHKRKSSSEGGRAARRKKVTRPPHPGVKG